MGIKLVYVGDKEKKREDLEEIFADPIELSSSIHRIGRGEIYNDIVLTNYDPTVSRKHVIFDTKKLKVTDLGSHNGTFINGESIGKIRAKNSDEMDNAYKEIVNELREEMGLEVNGYDLKKILNKGMQKVKNGDIITFGLDWWSFKIEIN